MEKCSNCGAMINTGAEHCEYCGVSYGGKTKNTENNFVAESKNVTESKIKISTILGIFSIVFSTTIIGLVLAILGLKESKKDDGQVGKILSIIAIVVFIFVSLSVVVTIIGAIIGGIAFFDTVNDMNSEFGYEVYNNINLMMNMFIR